uniref:Hydroxysteroid 11-beta-dehydrogenase 1-like protein n=1 Tax=Aegilops tauschii TaxID=37682 RepID=M8BXJ0_AEGTA
MALTLKVWTCAELGLAGGHRATRPAIRDVSWQPETPASCSEAPRASLSWPHSHGRHLSQFATQPSSKAPRKGGRKEEVGAVMEMLSMLKVGYTVLRSETPATDLVNTFMDWAARRSLLLLALFMPPYHVYKLAASAAATVAPEDVAGKVVLITGASSGIGEQIAYQYAKKGARLALVARREGSLREVAAKATDLGSPDVLVVPGDVARPEDCKAFVQATVERFGRLDHLVNNAGLANVCWFEEVPDVAGFKQILASKAAVLSFAETLRMELGDEMGVTVATPGWIESEMTKGKHLSKGGRVEVDQDTRNAQVRLFPVVRAERCAEAIVDAVCRGRRSVTVPLWYRGLFLWRSLAPEVGDVLQRVFYRRSSGDGGSQMRARRVLEVTGAKRVLQPPSLHTSDIKWE